ncbi:MAG: carboxypeptidase-like regulatory domain-containing protein [Candidatus Velthaea sp.]|jgi:hypothetical protein
MTFTKLSRTAFVAGMLAVSTVAGCGNPNPNGVTETGTITGRLVDAKTQQPIPQAQIRVGTIVYNVSAGDQGGFTLSNVPIGQQTVYITAIGYSLPSQDQPGISVIVQNGQNSALGIIQMNPTI